MQGRVVARSGAAAYPEGKADTDFDRETPAVPEVPPTPR